MEAGHTYNPNKFRIDLPDSLKNISADLFFYLRELSEGLRSFNQEALNGALRIPNDQLLTRYAREDFPLDSRASVLLASGESAYVKFCKFSATADPANVGRLVYESASVVSADGDPQLFAGIDFTKNGTGLYGWVVIGGLIQVPNSIWNGAAGKLLGPSGAVLSDSALFRCAVSQGANKLRLVPLFALPEEVDVDGIVSQINALLNSSASAAEKISALETRCASLESTVAEMQNLMQLTFSRFETKSSDVNLDSTYSKILKLGAGFAKLNEELKVTSQLASSQANAARTYANSAYNFSIDASNAVTQTAAIAQATLTKSLEASAASEAAAASASVAESWAVEASESAAAASVDYTTLSSVVSGHTASISSINTSLSTQAGINSSQATFNTTISSRVGTVESFVSVQAGVNATLDGRTESYFRITSSAGGRAQLEIYSSSTGSAGVDITGDVNITGSVKITGIIKANGFVTNEGVDLAAMVPGTIRSKGSVDVNPGGVIVTCGTMGSAASSVYSFLSMPKITTSHVIRTKIDIRAGASNATFPGNPTPSANVLLMYSLDAGANWYSTGLYVGVSPPTTSSSTNTYQNTDFGAEIASSWTGAIMFGVKGEVFGGSDAGISIFQMTCVLEVLGSK